METRSSRYVKGVIKYLLSMPAIPGGAPFGVDNDVEGMTVYCSPYMAIAIPNSGYVLKHEEASTIHNMSSRLRIGNYGVEVKDTGRREVATVRKKKIELTIFACASFEIRVNSADLKLFSGAAVRYYAARPDTMLLIEGDVIGIPNEYGIGAIMPITKRT